MFSIKGQVMNVFTVAGTEKYPGEKYKVQLLGDQYLKDGQVKKDLVTLTVPSDLYPSLQGAVGETISLPVGLFVDNGRIQPFIPKGSLNGRRSAEEVAA